MDKIKAMLSNFVEKVKETFNTLKEWIGEKIAGLKGDHTAASLESVKPDADEPAMAAKESPAPATAMHVDIAPEPAISPATDKPQTLATTSNQLEAAKAVGV